jgi:putative ABC transport system permease protein
MIAKLAWKNIWFKPLNTVLSIILLAASVAIITVLILLQKQFEEKLSKNIDGVDLVLGAQGSPMQLILSSVYHIDNPTGNIDFDSAKVWMKHPYIEKAIPLAFGDNYKGVKILGTTVDYLEKYNAKLESGRLFSKNFEVVIGNEIAKKLTLKIGSSFFGSHGSAAEGEVHEHYDYKVVGILKPTGQVIDNLIVCNIPSVWQIHGEEHENAATEEVHVHDENCNHEHEEEQHVHDEHCNHNHQKVAQDFTIDKPGMEITAVLLKFRNKMGIVMWPRIISQNTKMQAASPAIEVNRLFSLFGIGLNALEYLAYAIMLISGISIFISLYNRLKEREYEFALMRINGAKRLQLFVLLLLEGMFLCLIGFFLGSILGRLSLHYISNMAQDDYKMSFNPLEIVWQKEVLLFAITLLVGLLASLVPSIKAYFLNISKTLANA